MAARVLRLSSPEHRNSDGPAHKAGPSPSLGSYITWDNLLRPDTLLILAANLLPLLGVFLAGWDASVLIVLYWLETAVIGFWMLVRVLFAPADALPPLKTVAGDATSPANGFGLALFLLAHAGIFMAVHMIFLSALLPGEWKTHLLSPIDFVTQFVIPTGLWIPLVGLFLVRGILTVNDMRTGAPLLGVIVGFYVRIFVMQLTVIFGGMLAIAVGGVVMLALLVAMKTAVDLLSTAIVRYVVEIADLKTKR